MVLRNSKITYSNRGYLGASEENVRAGPRVPHQVWALILEARSCSVVWTSGNRDLGRLVVSCRPYLLVFLDFDC